MTSSRYDFGEGTTLGNAFAAFLEQPGQLYMRRREWPAELVLWPSVTTPGTDMLLRTDRTADRGPYHLTLQDFFATDWVVVDQ